MIEDILIFGYILLIVLFFYCAILRKKKYVRLNYQKQFYQEHEEEIQKYTKSSYDLNKDKNEAKTKRQYTSQTKTKRRSFFLIRHEEITLSFD
jgi:hypothetical protein